MLHDQHESDGIRKSIKARLFYPRLRIGSDPVINILTTDSLSAVCKQNDVTFEYEKTLSAE